MTLAYLQGYYKLRSRWSLLYFHVVIRVASQSCGVAFGVVGFDNLSLFVAYLVLSAEGFFTLVICTYRFLISWQNHNRFNQRSTLEPHFSSKKDKSKAAVRSFAIWPLLWFFVPSRLRENPMIPVHNLLYIGNILIIAGGSIVQCSFFSILAPAEPADPVSPISSAIRLRR